MSLVTKKIHELTPLGGSVVNGDELVIYDVSTNKTKKITVGDLYTVGIPASVIPYDNTTIGIDQTNVQDAITWTSFRQFAANTTGSTANDTPSFWKKGNGHSIFSAYMLKDQPYQYGHLINFNNKPSDSGEIFQFYKTGPNGDLYHRGAHSSEPDMLAWRRIVDGDNSTAFKSGGIKTSNTGGYETDQYGNFVHSSSSTQNSWNIQKNNATNVFTVNFETGAVSNPGASGWQTVQLSGTYGTAMARRYMGLVFLTVWGLKPGTTWTVATTALPSKYIPQQSVYGAGFHGGNGKIHMTYLINTSGQIQTSTQTTSSSNDGQFSVCYIPANN